MDNLTHTLIGVAVAKAGLSKRIGKGTTWILAVASNLPDIDIALNFLGLEDAFLYRRTLTHSVVGVPIIALAASWIFKRWAPQIGYRKILALVLFGMGLHVLFDLMNSYGVVVFYPLSGARLELAWLFIIDLAIWGMLLFPLILERFPVYKSDEVRRERLWKIFVSVFTLYVMACGAFRARAENLLEREVTRLQLVSADPYVFPEALGFHRFHGVIHEGQTLRHYQVGVFSNRVDLVETYTTVQSDPRLGPLLETPRVVRLMAFFKRPVFKWESPTRVSVFDLRFRSTVLTMRHAFSFEFEVPAQLVSPWLSAYTHSS